MQGRIVSGGFGSHRWNHWSSCFRFNQHHIPNISWVVVFSGQQFAWKWCGWHSSHKSKRSYETMVVFSPWQDKSDKKRFLSKCSFWFVSFSPWKLSILENVPIKWNAVYLPHLILIFRLPNWYVRKLYHKGTIKIVFNVKFSWTAFEIWNWKPWGKAHKQSDWKFWVKLSVLKILFF